MGGAVGAMCCVSGVYCMIMMISVCISHDQMIVFDLDACAADALKGDTIVCSDYNVRIPLHHLVPDLLLTDLPQQLRIDTSQFEFNPKVMLGWVGLLLCGRGL